MFEFQFGYMYWRYFMWNYVGKQDDIQGRYDNHGNWLSGINFVDNARLGSQENLPSDIKNNKGRNTYFFLPLLLGIIGLIFQISKNPKQFWALVRILYVHGYCHSVLYQSSHISAEGAGLFPGGLLLCFCHLDRLGCVRPF